MTKLNEEECRVVNDFMEYYKHLKKNNIIQAAHGDFDNIDLLNIGAAVALAVKKKVEEVVSDPFAQEGE